MRTRRLGAKISAIMATAAALSPWPARWSPKAASVDAGAAGITIVHYDPDADYQVLPRIIASLEEYLSTAVGPVRIVGVPDIDAVRSRVEQTNAAFAIIPDSALQRRSVAELDPRQLLRPERNGVASFRKVLIARRGLTTEQLRNSRIATADIGARGAGRAHFLNSLKRGGVDVVGAQLLPLSKDIDALFALTVGQADAALVTRGSVSLLRDLDPNTANSLAEFWVSPPRLFPSLCAVGTSNRGVLQQSVLRAFEHMHKSAKGRAALEISSYDRWVAVGGTQ